MNALRFAWLSLIRQPARTSLGVLGVAAVGALLFDMLLLSQGLIVSMRDLLDRAGYDIRVTATADLPRVAPVMQGARAAVTAIARESGVRAALAIRFADAKVERSAGTALDVTLSGVAGTPAPWTTVRGQDIKARDEVVVDEKIAAALHLAPGDSITVRGSCRSTPEVLPSIRFRVAGIATFPFELVSENSIGTSLDGLEDACGAKGADEADMVLVISTGDPDATAARIQALRPDTRVATNQQMLGRIEEGGFTYFRQISTVLTTVTVAFALLLITVLLTVSVNQRLGEIAALRALGLSARRMIADILCESALIVGGGGLLSLPLGMALAMWLDRILKRMPGIPSELHFFVFEPSALGIHIALLVTTAIVAALYPMRIVATLPIAATLRNEVIG